MVRPGGRIPTRNPDVTGSDFGRLLRAQRMQAGLTQERLAHHAGISVRTLRNLEGGRVRRPRGESMRLLAHALGLAGAARAEFEAAALGGHDGVGDGKPANRTVVLSQLPPDLVDFTGREETTARLTVQLAAAPNAAADATTAVVVSSIAGKAGVGKTSLAVHAAHRLRSRFPDGQLYVNLRGAEAQALDPAVVLAGFLRALGTEGRSIPADAEERAGMYRSLLADRCMLVLLDNAADEAQVRPLLPGGRSNAVLITSRSRLAGLALAEVVDLDVLSPEQALELLSKIAGPGRVEAEPDAARAIAGLCGCLPLALRIAGAKLAARPRWRLQRLVDRLGEEHGRLDELAAGDLEVRASVALSYQSLDERQRQAFRLLGLLEVGNFAAWMLAALLDIPGADAESLAEELVDAQLLETPGEDGAGQVRYRFHDLIRLFARERLAAEETPATRHAALQRTLQTYFTAAQDSLLRLRLRLPQPPAQPTRIVPRDITSTLARAYQWLAAEHDGLVLSVEQAWREGLGPLAEALAEQLADFFEVYAQWDDWERIHQVALRAARRAADRHAEASLLRGLGDLRRNQRRFVEALDYSTRSRTIFAELGDTQGEIDSLIGLARAQRRGGHLADAVASFQEAVRLCRATGDRDREAKATLFFAKVVRQQGRFDDAITLLTSSVEMFESGGNVGYAAYARLTLAVALHEMKEHEQAATHLLHCLTFVRTLADPRWEAYALLYLGINAEARHLHDEARQLLAQALTLFQQVGDQEGTARVLALSAGSMR